MQISIKDNVDRVLRQMRDFPRNEVPFAMAKALTKTAQDVQAAEIHEVKDVFDRPTPYTLSSFYVKPATKSKLEARVYIKNEASKGTPAIKFLKAQIEGGARKQKRFEKALQAAGIMPAGYYAVPGEGAKLDSYGNLDRGLIVQLLAYFKAFPEAGYKANMTDKRKAALAKGNAKKGQQGVAYFVGQPGKKSPLGVWARYRMFGGSAVKPVLIFIKSAKYEQLLDFYYVSDVTARKKMDKNVRAEMAEILKKLKS